MNAAHQPSGFDAFHRILNNALSLTRTRNGAISS
jgi:hypothetical protein